MSDEIICKKCEEIIHEPPSMLGKDFYHSTCLELELLKKYNSVGNEDTQELIDKSTLMKDD